MIRFNNDYNRAAHPAVLAALTGIRKESFGGYGLDPMCERAAAEIAKHLDCPAAEVHFLTGGTQANFTVIAAALRPYQSVLCADTGHIHAHETGAVEHTGHKIEALPGTNGKITAAQIGQAAVQYETSGVREHITQPKLVYLSFPTEYGTLYTKQELEDISAVCRTHGLYLFVDGARLGYGLGAAENDVAMSDIARLADVFTVGGTKCGALFGEAVVITNDTLKPDFRSCMKQSGAMLAKGFLLGAQFEALFRDGLYFDITRRADEMAERIRRAFREKGVPFYVESGTNQIFVVLENTRIAALGRRYTFEPDAVIDKTHTCVRFCTSWSTTEDEITALIGDIAQL